MKILVTGSAGFIGFHVAKALIERGYDVIGIDNINNYYDPALKFARLREAGIAKKDVGCGVFTKSDKYPNYRFSRIDITDKKRVLELISDEKPDIVCHLAAQAGVRHSITNPDVYVESNITGFLNILEACRRYPVRHLLYASSSSVYGLNREQPFATAQKTDTPVSLYAATKKANELMAHAYSHLYGIPTTGLRFFTVYGPWGRPDMAPFIFTEAIIQGKPIKVYNNGEMFRDFTYVDDIAHSIILLLEKGPKDKCNLFNIGNGNPINLLNFISCIERCLGIEAVKEFLPLQDGDMISTLADSTELEQLISFRPSTEIEKGVRLFTQ